MEEPRPLGSKDKINRYLKEKVLYILKSRVLPISTKKFSKLDRNEKIKEDRRNPLNRLCCTRTANKSVCHRCLLLKLPACNYVFHSERRLIEHLIDQEANIGIHMVLSEDEMKALCSPADQRQTAQKKRDTVQTSRPVPNQTADDESFLDPTRNSPTFSHQVIVFALFDFFEFETIFFSFIEFFFLFKDTKSTVDK